MRKDLIRFVWPKGIENSCIERGRWHRLPIHSFYTQISLSNSRKSISFIDIISKGFHFFTILLRIRQIHWQNKSPQLQFRFFRNIFLQRWEAGCVWDPPAIPDAIQADAGNRMQFMSVRRDIADKGWILTVMLYRLIPSGRCSPNDLSSAWNSAYPFSAKRTHQRTLYLTSYPLQILAAMAFQGCDRSLLYPLNTSFTSHFKGPAIEKRREECRRVEGICHTVF